MVKNNKMDYDSFCCSYTDSITDSSITKFPTIDDYIATNFIDLSCCKTFVDLMKVEIFCIQTILNDKNNSVCLLITISQELFKKKKKFDHKHMISVLNNVLKYWVKNNQETILIDIVENWKHCFTETDFEKISSIKIKHNKTYNGMVVNLI